MKITKLETFFVKPRWVLLKMHTDEGLVGWGEPTLEGWSRTVAAAVDEMGRYLTGKDPRRIEHHWQALYRGGFYRGGPVVTSALSGIEQAMWDIKGKALGVPVWQLLGGAVRDRVRLYCHVHAPTADDLVALGRKVVGWGFGAIKTSPAHGAIRFVEPPAFVEEVVRRMTALREALGPDIDIAIDFGGRTSPAIAIQLCRALEPMRPMFIEEPCLPENVEALATVARSTSVPIATGERLFTKWGFRELLAKQAAAILQPDLSHAGGIFEVRKIAAMAEVHYASVAPHCPLGPVAFAACLQLAACTPNHLIQEQVGFGEGYLKTPFVMTGGCVDIPTGPGLGIEIDEDAIRGQLHDGSWANPRFWNPDGSLADW